MELRHLRAFEAVAATLNFTRAAAQLRIAQPALSRTIRQLEDEIGVDLLRRTPRGAVLTAEGRHWLDATRDILGRLETAVEDTRATARGETGELRIGYSPSPTAELLPPALAAFGRACPRVQVRLEDLSAAELWSGLREDRIELALTSRPLGESAAGLRFEPLQRYPICVAVAPGHPFARRRAVTVAEAAAEPLVAFRRREYADYHRLLRRVFGERHRQLRVAGECDGASSLITAIEAGRGIAVLATVFARVAGTRLRFRPLRPAPEPLEVGICTAEQGDLTPAGERFCALVRAAAARAPE